jgi:hypothetical protein
MKAMRKLLIVVPLLLVVAPGCDATRRDFSVCDRTYACNDGFTCDLDAGLCVPERLDSGGVDTQTVDAGNHADLSSSEANVLDANDAPVAIDGALVTLDGAGDTSSLDGVKDTTIIDAAQGVDGVGSDTRVPDAAGSCSVDLECTSGHCLNGKCVACKTSSHCSNTAGLPFCSAQNTCVSCASSGGASACTGTTPVCEPVSGRCVECADNASCTTDPNKAFCVASQCVGCGAPGATSTTVDGGILDGGTTSVCKGATPMCATSGRCVECLQNSECTADPDKAFCVANQCVGCNVSGAAASAHDGGATGACIGATPECSTSGRCVECLHNSECTTDPDKAFCVQNTCQGCNATASTSDAGVTYACPSATPQCQSATGLCVECLAKSDCSSASKGFCHQSACTGCADSGDCTGATPVCMSSTSSTSKAGQCVGCADSGDCSGNSPICDTTTTFTCQACTSDAQCAAKGGGPGVCLTDGHCATEAETVYVGTSGSATCNEANAGTASAPVCSAQNGVSLATSTKPLVVIRGTLTTVSTAAIAVSFPLTIVGKNAAVLTAAVGGNCVSITQGEVYLRNLTLQGNSSSATGVGIGISAAPTSGSTVTLHMDTCEVINNKGGGILLNGAAFDVTNTSVTGNKKGRTGTTTWGGILVQSVLTSGTKDLNLVTIQGNDGGGITCADGIQGTGVLASDNTSTSVGDIDTVCGITTGACTTLSSSCGAQSAPQ